MKAVKINLAGAERYLAFTGEAMFTIKDEFGGVSELLSAMGNDTREGYAATCKAAAILAEQGELARRHMGHTPADIVDAEVISALTSPAEYAAVKAAIPVAIALGFGREIEDKEEEIDLVLVELQKKTT